MKKYIFNLLCNPITGKIISLIFSYNIPNIRNGFKRYITPKNYCNDRVRAMIFFGFYESAEMRLVKNYIPKQVPIIELGSSLGVVSSTVIQYINIETDYTCIEANPYLIDYIKTNIKNHNSNKTNFSVINAAIAYNTNGTIKMNISKNNTESSLINEKEINNAQAISVNTISLNSLVKQPYTLICDIEGAEIDVFKNDAQALKLCEHLFIELHATQYNKTNYSVRDLQNILENELSFKLEIADGNVFYYKK